MKSIVDYHIHLSKECNLNAPFREIHKPKSRFLTLFGTINLPHHILNLLVIEIPCIIRDEN